MRGNILTFLMGATYNISAFGIINARFSCLSLYPYTRVSIEVFFA